MYLNDSSANAESSNALALLTAAAASPGETCQDDPETQRAFDESLRALAEDIIEYHPGLAHILIGMSKSPCPVVHGQN
ncbi:MAG: hypothetical protein GXX91_03365 [Verrucomicrobiaceae bacterium]|nr:hypothetical protein [Verrucomicrobiaceae bacterium]